MKRVKENDEEKVSENSGFKKVRFFNAIENDDVLGRSQVEKEMIFAENEMTDSAEVEGISGLLGSEVSGDLSPNLGGMKEAVNRDSDVNLDVIFGNEEPQKGLGFDLNVPFSQEPTHEGSSINVNMIEIIDIVSSDSDDEVEIIGFRSDSKANKQIEIPMPYDRTENLILDLELNKIDYFVGESSSVAGGEKRYASKEKGMTTIDNPWLSLSSFCSIGLNTWPESEIPIRIREPREVQFIEMHPVALAPIPELEELELRIEEHASIRRMDDTRVNLRKTAKRFARVNHLGESSGNESAGQETKSHAIEFVQGLGNFSGPFSEALQLVRERTSKRATQDLIKWGPSEENWDNSITAPLVPSLLDLSLKALAENAERIVSLELVPDILRRRLSDILCDTNRMGIHFLNLLLKGYPTELRIKNCSWLTEKQFQQAFGNCQTKYLKVLQLDLCGQCMLDFAFRDILSQSPNSFSSLAIISLRGACRLSDSGLKELVMAAPSLRSINLGQCTLLTCDGIYFIAEFLGSNLRELFIDDCQKINAMLILPAFKNFRHLEVLSVAEIQTVTDQFINEVIISCGESMKELDMANCLELTDRSLKAIGSSCGDLRSLNISNLHKLTDLGILYLTNGCRSIQKLKLCRSGFSDEAMASFLECHGESLTELSLNNMAKVGPNTVFSLAKCSRKLLSLDISWCRRITNEDLGLIVDSCTSLKLLKVFGCKQITRVFLNGHSNPFVQIIGLNLTPLLENMNLLEREQVLLRYSPLPVCTEAPMRS